MRLYASLHQVGRAVKLCPLKTKINKYAVFQPTPLSLESMLEFGSAKNAHPKKSFIFLRKELPVRLANIMSEFEYLPEQLNTMPSIKRVLGWYEQSFKEILEYESGDPNDVTLESFNQTLDMIRKRHEDVVPTTAKGVMEMIESHTDINETVHNASQYFLNRFYMNRISIRMLIHQHLMLFGSDKVQDHRHIGNIDPKCDVLAVAQSAYDNAKYLCEQNYLTSPECNFLIGNESDDQTSMDDKITMTYVPSHLYHMLFELFKNALRAVVETHGDKVPPINVLLQKGAEDFTIKISDQGGGVKRSELTDLFKYTYSTAPRPQDLSVTPMNTGQAHSLPDYFDPELIAGYGYGLPLSRLYASYFHGSLQLISVEGYGTDAYVYLKILTSDANELLPVFNKTSSSKYASSVPVGDWSDADPSTSLQLPYHQHHPVTGGNQRNFSTQAPKSEPRVRLY